MWILSNLFHHPRLITYNMIGLGLFQEALNIF